MLPELAVAIKLEITLNTFGHVNVSGPLENPLMCYGLLEVARQIIAQHTTRTQELVQPVTIMPPMPSSVS